jgi:hypothetical protein
MEKTLKSYKGHAFLFLLSYAFLFGLTMNMCSKINSKAPTNGVAIGEGLYKVIEIFSCLSSLEENCYHFANILLIDDEEDILFTFKEGLASEGYNPKCSTSLFIV